MKQLILITILIILNLSSIKLTSKHSCKWNSRKCKDRYVIKVVFGNHLKCYWLIAKSNWSLMDEALCFTYIPTKICWSSRYVLKTSSKCLQRNNFSPLRRLGRQKNITLKISSRHVLNTSWTHVLKMSWSQKKTCLLGISVSNNAKSVSNKSISDESKVNPKCIN